MQDITNFLSETFDSLMSYGRADKGSTWQIICYYVTLKPRFAFEWVLLVYCLAVALMCKQRIQGKYWLEGVVVTAFTCFGGGILVPVLLGHNSFYPFPLLNDAAIPFAVLGWWLVCCCPRDLWNKCMKSTPVASMMGIGFELCRCKLIIFWLTAATQAIKPSYFSFPVFGPVVCGTIGGCGGMFFPLSKGMEPISVSTPWPLESAFIVSVFYHLTTSSAIADLGLLSGDNAHTTVALFLIATRLAPVLQDVLVPVRAVLYRFTLITPPITAKKAAAKKKN